MTKYKIIHRGYGKGSYEVVESCSNSEAKKLERSGEKTFTKREEALEYIKRKR